MDFTRMPKSELMRFCGDDPQRWSEAYLQTMPPNPDRHELAKFFADMMAVAADTRRARAAECEER